MGMRLFTITFVALATLSLACCGKADGPNIGNYPSDGVVRIDAGVLSPQTRADAVTSSLYDGSNLGLFLDYGDGDKYTQSNVLWENAGSNAWSSQTQMLWKDASTPVGVYAYAPYDAAQTDPSQVVFSIPLDQSQGIESADLLWCPMQNFDPAKDLTTDRKVNVAFRHALIRLTVNFTFASQFEGQTISITKALLNCSMDKVAVRFRGDENSGGKSYVGASASTEPASIKMHDCSSEEKLSYEAIFFPQSLTAGQKMLTVTLSNGRNYILTLPGELVLEKDPVSGNYLGGRSYSLNVTVGKEKITLSTISITQWSRGPGGRLDVE